MYKVEVTHINDLAFLVKAQNPGDTILNSLKDEPEIDIKII